MANRIKIVYSKLGKNWGWAHYEDDSIELDTRLKGKKHLEIISHEAFHLLFPFLNEDEVVEKSITLTNTLWHDGYRKIDDSNDTPMQDGSI